MFVLGHVLADTLYRILEFLFSSAILLMRWAVLFGSWNQFLCFFGFSLAPLAKICRILVNCNMWFGCCHNGGRFSPQCTFFEFRTRVRVIFLIWKSPQSYMERGMTLMTFELTFSDLCQLALVIIALIELFRKREHKKRWAALPKEPAHLFESNWGLTVHRQPSFYF